MAGIDCRFLFCVLVCLLVAVPASAAPLPAEAELTASYVLNVLRMITRHPAEPPPRQLTVAVFAPGAVGEALQNLQNRVVSGRRLVVKPVWDESELAGVDAVLFGRSSGKVSRMLAAAGRLRLLTIGVDDRFIQAGGMVSLRVEDRRVAVTLNMKSLDAAGFTVSSHLLEVARMAGGVP